VILSPRGELTVAEAPRLRSELLSAIKQSLDPTIIVDLTEVTFIDATVVGVLIGARERLAKDGRRLRIAGPSKQVQRTLELIGLDKVVQVFPTLAQAEADES
jgi:anti-sigma B factor antagonist